jgi:ArsR family transcriptional regulator
MKTRKADASACCSIDIEGEAQERFLAMLRAAGNPARFEVLKYLVTHPGCITGEIVAHLPLAQATVSQHLKVLRDAGWIKGEVEGPATCYELDVQAIGWFRSVVGRIF